MVEIRYLKKSNSWEIWIKGKRIDLNDDPPGDGRATLTLPLAIALACGYSAGKGNDRHEIAIIGDPNQFLPLHVYTEPFSHKGLRLSRQI